MFGGFGSVAFPWFCLWVVATLVFAGFGALCLWLLVLCGFYGFVTFVLGFDIWLFC